jgi:hypothetical protein
MPSVFWRVRRGHPRNSALSSVVFIAIGIHTHHSGLVIFSVAGIALSVVQFTYRRRHHTAAAQK